TVVLTEPMLLAAAEPAADLRAFRSGAWIMGRPGTLCRLAAERICQAAGFEPRVRHQTDDFPTALALVAAGQGQAILPRLGAVDAGGGAQAGRSAGEVDVAADVRPAGPRLVQPGDHLTRAQQHRRGVAGWAADDVHAPVHAVREVHIGVPGRAEHHLVAPGTA